MNEYLLLALIGGGIYVAYRLLTAAVKWLAID